jgi:hypothetical protein
MIYRQTTITHSLSNITIYIFQYPFPIALEIHMEILKHRVEYYTTAEFK